ncbi:ABC transporter substrate-binding protein [Pseudomonas fluorescens]|uniref:ABC transporter substrate-binding protein n=1 Tax=Pseudomonas fluorescens TaxID=294 RepID=UPI002ACA5127|nr:ABC transporter substrate-binding protein [Pseudomonas fluorescens]MDZ5431934.1 ABC transporter substrate-binding protein [Pseudomonas fluorescens]
MSLTIRSVTSIACLLLSSMLSVTSQANAAEIIKLGMSLPLSGTGANWGIGGFWLCKQAAIEISEKGGIKVGDKVFNFECLAYDNKYNAADGAKVAQTLLSKDKVKFVAGSLGTAPVRALQSLSERQGVLIFTTAWGASIKGPKFPLTFTQMNTPNEIAYPLVKYVKSVNAGVKTVALLNPNDATGQETEQVARKAWEAVGVTVLSSDWYERGTAEFQPIAAKMASLHPDVVDLCSSPPADSGRVFKELEGMGWNGVKVIEVGTGADGLLATGSGAVENTYMGAAITFSDSNSTEHQRHLNNGAKALTGESLNAVQIGFYDSVKALAAAIEKSQSIDPREVAKALATIKFDSFYGPSSFGGQSLYGSPQQMLIPVIVTQIKNGQLVEVERIQPQELVVRTQ